MSCSYMQTDVFPFTPLWIKELVRSYLQYVRLINRWMLYGKNICSFNFTILIKTLNKKPHLLWVKCSAFFSFPNSSSGSDHSRSHMGPNAGGSLNRSNCEDTHETYCKNCHDFILWIGPTEATKTKQIAKIVTISFFEPVQLKRH